MNEYILKQDVIDTIMGQPPDAHYPSWYAAQIEELPSADVIPIKWIQKKIDKSIGMEHAMWQKLLRMWENEQLRKYVRNLKDDNK